MADDGGGNFSLPSAAFVAGTTATAATVNANFTDIATALTGRVTRNGTGSMSGNLAMGNNKITGLASGSADTDAATLLQARLSGVVGVQVFTSSGTYTPTTGTRKVLVRVQAGGGGSGGCAATNAGGWAVGGAGAGGGYGEEFISSGFSGVTVTVGAGGAGGSAGANAGSTGGTSSFGSLISCSGGGGGSGGVSSSSAPAFDQSGIAAGGTATGANFSVPGEPAGGPPIALTVGLVMRPGGGRAMLGPGGAARTVSTNNAAGDTPAGYGGGGAGPINANSTFSAAAGAAGAPGIVIVTELG